MPTTTGESRYLSPDRFSRHVLNPVIAGLARIGIGLRGAHQLRVRGRRSGQWQTVPVNPLVVDGTTHLIAPRGNTEWVRNLRATGRCELRLGRRTTNHTAVEITDPTAAAPLLKAYLTRWQPEVGRHFGGLTPDSSVAEFASAATGYPVFVLADGTTSTD